MLRYFLAVLNLVFVVTSTRLFDALNLIKIRSTKKFYLNIICIISLRVQDFTAVFCRTFAIFTTFHHCLCQTNL